MRSGIQSAYAFFGKLGYTEKFPVTILFNPEINVDWSGGDDKKSVRVLGKYDEDEKTIYLTCWRNNWIFGRNDFDLDMTYEFYRTIVAHEMIHFLANRFAKNSVNSIFSEYILEKGQNVFVHCLLVVPKGGFRNLGFHDVSPFYSDFAKHHCFRCLNCLNHCNKPLLLNLFQVNLG